MKTPSFTFPFRLSAGVLGLMLATALFAQIETPLPPKESGDVAYADRNFLKKAAKAGDDEVSISTVAASRSTNTQVKELAQKIISDHQSMASQLSSLASTLQVGLPAREMTASKWEKRSPKSFDKDYLKEMVDQHEDAVSLFSKAAKSDDAQIATFASQHLPMLQSHLTTAKDLLKTVQ